MNFENIAEVAGAWLKVPENTQYSFYDSPYIGHRNTTAIDVYFKDREALLPIDEAKVKEIRWFNAPKYRDDAWDREPLILFDLGGNRVLKVLHVNPKVKIGEKLYLGDFFGKCIISGYFSPWNDSHAHFEVRPSNDPYRARGAFILNITPTVEKMRRSLRFLPKAFIVEEVKEYYMWVKPKGESNYLTPLVVRANNNMGYVDAGIPHYGLGGILVNTRINASTGDSIYWDSMYLGYVIKTYSSSLLFAAPIKVYVDNIRVKGVETYINGKFLKVIFMDFMGKKLWKEGDGIEIKVMVSK